MLFVASFCRYSYFADLERKKGSCCFPLFEFLMNRLLNGCKWSFMLLCLQHSIIPVLCQHLFLILGPYGITVPELCSLVLFTVCEVFFFILLSMDCDLIILSLGVLSLPAQQTRSFHSCLLHLGWLHGCCASGCLEKSMLLFIWKIQTWKIRACL